MTKTTDPFARRKPRYAIVASRFNQTITDQLLLGARRALAEQGVEAEQIHCVWVPGAFEIPLVCKQLMAAGDYAAIIALGAVIRGATSHFDYVAGECARGLAQLNLRGDIPIIFGVLTTDTAAQARHRADPKAANKGADFAVAAVDMVGVLQDL